ncbi:alpha-N-arabinofuranosidase [Vallicoccus soli]|uniref:non-reducing end alpha-L-arabinofuranosidase n=2 Tax=Vallicoccus soli TaxID=2339232 RepID=A0A3A3YR87_9ACTN|nr:alpha-N-arabinofuranosidase [Vallicoccus soli]
MGRCVYTGIHEPEHPSADADGFRRDVLDLVRELGPTVVRYPGGNFVSSYRWEDGVGPVDERPVRLELAWRAIEPNTVGLDEFAGWAQRAGLEPMMAVNLGTRGIQEACDVLEYANHPSGTYWSDLRIANGAKEPHGIKLWCLGNELDGPWQVGRKTPDEYGRLAAETAKAMRLVDPSVELVAVGSSHSQMPTFGTWEDRVLEHTYEHVDYVSMHAYYEELVGDLGTFLATAVDMDAFIDAVISTSDAVGARLRQRKRLKVAFDEWNVWYQRRFVGAPNLDWQYARPLIEDRFNVADAVVVGSFLVTLLNHAERLTVACQAQLVNVIAPIMTEPGGRAWRQTIFHPFAQASRLARGQVLRVEAHGPTYATAAYGEVPLLHATATHDPATGEVVVLAVNRGTEEPLPLEVALHGFGPLVLAEHSVLADDDPYAVNTADDPDRVVPREGRDARVLDGRLEALLPPVSWNVLRLAPPPRS